MHTCTARLLHALIFSYPAVQCYSGQYSQPGYRYGLLTCKFQWSKSKFAWLIATRSSSIFRARDITFESRNDGTLTIESFDLGVDSLLFTGIKTRWQQLKLLAGFNLELQILRDCHVTWIFDAHFVMNIWCPSDSYINDVISIIVIALLVL